MGARFFPLILFFLGCSHAFAANISLPEFDKNSAKTQALLNWSQNALEQVQKDINSAENYQSIYPEILKHLNSIPAEKISNNKRFFYDHQQIQSHFQEILYHFSVSKQHPKKIYQKIADQLEKLKAPSEFLLPSLFHTNLEKYYAHYRKALEIYESHPERLSVKPKVPPVFKLRFEFSIKTLHNILALCDLSKKLYWEPDPEVEEKLMLQLSRCYEKHQLIPYALSCLKMVENEKSNNIIKRKAHLEKIEASQTKRNSLY